MTKVVSAAVAALHGLRFPRQLRTQRLVVGADTSTKQAVPRFNFHRAAAQFKGKDVLSYRPPRDAWMPFPVLSNAWRPDADRGLRDSPCHAPLAAQSSTALSRIAIPTRIIRLLSGRLRRSRAAGADLVSLSAAWEALPIAILVVDRHGRMVLANGQAEMLFGYQHGDLIGAPVDLLVPVRHADSGRASSGELFRSLQEKACGPAQDLFARRRDGTQFPVELVLNTFRFERESASLMVVVDRTERYELHRNRQELAHLTRVSTLGEMASSLAHELNQPLTAILSNVQAAQRFMADDAVDLAEVREILTDIVEDSGRASEVIRRIRAFVKKDELELGPLDLAGVLRDVVILVHSDAIVRGIRVTLDARENLPAVRGDRVQLQQVVLNLLLNAFDAVNDCPSADRVVSLAVKSDRDGMVCIAVHDRGHGLTIDKLDKIFKPFFTSKPHGLGLGLSISRSIIDMHGGRIWAENNVDKGATFHVVLPSEGGAELGRSEQLS
ncbi:two-component system sensor kinase FixL [Paraburkholderia sp. BL23I1N1]|uniref:sensor histidine kinase n=1 Tax=Paraburkholderia sp. BL23I1N1 TaxID=1938802 RepID=UPI000FF273B9|nr:ATP-binding protein [Paraburkholderia sp. BL23I1N1]RKE39467.1 two-component system sensor kinase FixL [Paraburkholderia sp. BL23I1N1]